MSGTVQAEAHPKTADTQPVVVKKYANRRLYNTESSSYITLDNLADMVRQGRDFVVYDAKTGEDITRSVLTQIIVEEEGKGRALLPTAFLRQLIGFYGDQMQSLVPRFLEQALGAFAAAAGADAGHHAKDDGLNGDAVPVRQHGRGQPAEHGDDGAGVQPVHALLSRRDRSGFGAAIAGDRCPARRGGSVAPGACGGESAASQDRGRLNSSLPASKERRGRPACAGHDDGRMLFTG